MTRLLSTSKLKEKAEELRKVKSGYGLKAALFGALIEPVNEAKKEERTYSRKKANFLGHYTNNSQLVLGKDTNRCKVLTLNPCKEFQIREFSSKGQELPITQWGYCTETNVLKLTMNGNKYYYLHVTSNDMDQVEDYEKFMYFYNSVIRGRKDCIKV